MENEKEKEKGELLEIDLISAQDLKAPFANIGSLRTYAVAWVDPSVKLRTLVDQFGGKNPTWNEKFFFRVTDDFLCRQTSGISIEIYAVGYIKDSLIGSVRFLISTCFPGGDMTSPSFTAVQVRRQSGRFHGVLNIAAVVVQLDIKEIKGLSAVRFRDLIRYRHRRRRREQSWSCRIWGFRNWCILFVILLYFIFSK